MKHPRVRKVLFVLAANALVMSLSACAIGPDNLPSVRGGIGEGYNLNLEFSSVMNLPTGADVIMDGLRIGEVRSLSVVDDVVTVSAGIRSDTKVPANSRAIVRQDTLLGDTYIALNRDTDGNGTVLAPGGTIPVDRTTSPPQLEDTIAVLANFVNGGSIQKIEDAMAQVNRVMPPMDAVHDLASIVAVDMRDLSRNVSEIDRTLNGLNETAISVIDRTGALNTIFDTSSVHYWRRVAVSVVSHIGQILPSVGSVYEGGLWLVPMLNSLADSGDVIGVTLAEAPETSMTLSNFLRTTIIPFAAHPSIDVESVESSSGTQLVTDAETILRMLGAVK